MTQDKNQQVETYIHETPGTKKKKGHKHLVMNKNMTKQKVCTTGFHLICDNYMNSLAMKLYLHSDWLFQCHFHSQSISRIHYYFPL